LFLAFAADLPLAFAPCRVVEARGSVRIGVLARVLASGSLALVVLMIFLCRHCSLLSFGSEIPVARRRKRVSLDGPAGPEVRPIPVQWPVMASSAGS
jgi:hypothetical protein